MKILLDVDALEQNGTISPALAATLRTAAAQETGNSAIHLILGFGAVAMSAGLLALVPYASVAVGIGLTFVAMGYVTVRELGRHWHKLGNTWMVVGALISAGATGILLNQPILSPLATALILGTVSLIARSALLMSLAPLALASALGGSTGYEHATYAVAIEEPTRTIFLFSGLAIATWYVGKYVQPHFKNLALAFGRMSVLLVNMGFWVGSLWGDAPISPRIFSISWALALCSVGYWGAQRGRRFVVNIAAVFGTIHAYTQWFEYFGGHPLSVIIAGGVTIILGAILWRYNRTTPAHPVELVAD